MRNGSQLVKNRLRQLFALFVMLNLTFALLCLSFLVSFGFSRVNVFIAFFAYFAFSVAVFIVSVKDFITRMSAFAGRLNELFDDALHELNIPISTIKANTQMLKQSITDEKSLQRLSRIELASDALILRYTNLKASVKMELSSETRECFELSNEIKKECLLFEEEAAKKSIAIELDLSEYEVFVVKADFLAAFSNLLSNAIKYNHDGGTVEIKLASGVLCIKDSGIGMDERTVLRVFDRYFQANRNSDGLGLGLSIVKAFCDKEGIKISIKSRPNEGCEISLKF